MKCMPCFLAGTHGLKLCVSAITITNVCPMCETFVKLGESTNSEVEIPKELESSLVS